MQVGLMIIKILFYLLSFGALLFLAYVSTRLIGTKISKGMRGKYIKIIDSIALRFDQHIYLIKIGEQLLLVSSSNRNIQFLTILDNNLIQIKEEDLAVQEQEYQLDVKEMFRTYFEKFKNFYKKDQNILKEDSNTSTIKFNENLVKLKTIFSNMKSKKNEDGKSNE